MVNKYKNLYQVFFEKGILDPITECYISTQNSRYSHVQIGNKTISLHVIAYKLFIGNIPKNHEIDHICQNKLCFNPLHLEAVTHKVNIKRFFERNPITHCKNNHEFTKENTYTKPNGKRECRKCRLMRNKKNDHFRWTRKRIS